MNMNATTMALKPTTTVPEWTLADRLRKVRLLTGLNQKGMASSLGLSAPTYSAYESGRNQPRANQLMSMIKRIELMTGVPATWMLGIYEETPPPAGDGANEVTVRHQGLEPRTHWLSPHVASLAFYRQRSNSATKSA